MKSVPDEGDEGVGSAETGLEITGVVESTISEFILNVC